MRASGRDGPLAALNTRGWEWIECRGHGTYEGWGGEGLTYALIDLLALVFRESGCRGGEGGRLPVEGL